MEKYQINSVLLAQACPAMVNHLSSTPSEVYPTLLYCTLADFFKQVHFTAGI